MKTIVGVEIFNATVAVAVSNPTSTNESAKRAFFYVSDTQEGAQDFYDTLTSDWNAFVKSRPKSVSGRPLNAPRLNLDLRGSMKVASEGSSSDSRPTLNLGARGFPGIALDGTLQRPKESSARKESQVDGLLFDKRGSRKAAVQGSRTDAERELSIEDNLDEELTVDGIDLDKRGSLRVATRGTTDNTKSMKLDGIHGTVDNSTAERGGIIETPMDQGMAESGLSTFSQGLVAQDHVNDNDQTMEKSGPSDKVDPYAPLAEEEPPILSTFAAPINEHSEESSEIIYAQPDFGANGIGKVSKRQEVTLTTESSDVIYAQPEFGTNVPEMLSQTFGTNVVGSGELPYTEMARADATLEQDVTDIYADPDIAAKISGGRIVYADPEGEVAPAHAPIRDIYAKPNKAAKISGGEVVYADLGGAAAPTPAPITDIYAQPDMLSKKKAHSVPNDLKQPIIELSMTKGSEGLGMGLHGPSKAENMGWGIFVGNIKAGGLAESKGLKTGMRILEVNGQDVTKASKKNAGALIKDLTKITFKVQFDADGYAVYDNGVLRDHMKRLTASVAAESPYGTIAQFQEVSGKDGGVSHVVSSSPLKEFDEREAGGLSAIDALQREKEQHDAEVKRIVDTAMTSSLAVCCSPDCNETEGLTPDEDNPPDQYCEKCWTEWEP